jgi:hypothetical protein
MVALAARQHIRPGFGVFSTFALPLSATKQNHHFTIKKKPPIVTTGSFFENIIQG